MISMKNVLHDSTSGSPRFRVRFEWSNQHLFGRRFANRMNVLACPHEDRI